MSKTKTPSCLNRMSNLFFKKKQTFKIINKNAFNQYSVEIEAKEISLQTMGINALNKNIKNLEFINHLEMNLQDKQINNMPLEFLTDLKTLKQHSQCNLLTTLHAMNNLE